MKPCVLSTDQLDDLDEDPVVSRGGHEFEEERGQRQVVLGISAGQLTDDIYCCWLDALRGGNRLERKSEKKGHDKKCKTVLIERSLTKAFI